MERQTNSKRISENDKMIDDYKPDPNAPSFGSASGAMENAGWRNYFKKRWDKYNG